MGTHGIEGYSRNPRAPMGPWAPVVFITTGTNGFIGCPWSPWVPMGHTLVHMHPRSTHGIHGYPCNPRVPMDSTCAHGFQGLQYKYELHFLSLLEILVPKLEFSNIENLTHSECSENPGSRKLPEASGSFRAPGIYKQIQIASSFLSC